MEVYWAHAKQLLDLDLKIRFENKTQGTEGMAQQLRVHIDLLKDLSLPVTDNRGIQVLWLLQAPAHTYTHTYRNLKIIKISL